MKIYKVSYPQVDLIHVELEFPENSRMRYSMGSRIDIRVVSEPKRWCDYFIDFDETSLHANGSYVIEWSNYHPADLKGLGKVWIYSEYEGMTFEQGFQFWMRSEPHIKQIRWDSKKFEDDIKNIRFLLQGTKNDVKDVSENLRKELTEEFTNVRMAHDQLLRLTSTDIGSINKNIENIRDNVNMFHEILKTDELMMSADIGKCVDLGK